MEYSIITYYHICRACVECKDQGKRMWDLCQWCLRI